MDFGGMELQDEGFLHLTESKSWAFGSLVHALRFPESGCRFHFCLAIFCSKNRKP